MLGRHNLETGEATADLPDEFPLNRLVDLSQGGVGVAAAARAALVARIVQFLESSDRALVVFEDQLAKPTDPVMQRSPTCMASFGDELYHLLVRSDANAETVEATLCWQANAWQELVFFSQLTEPLGPSCPPTLSDRELNIIARGVVAICVGAFDGEGYVTWSAGPG